MQTDNPEYGLAEIKAEIRGSHRLEQCCNGGGNCPTEFEVMTTGPMFKANQASSVIAQVLNYFRTRNGHHRRFQRFADRYQVGGSGVANGGYA